MADDDSSVIRTLRKENEDLKSELSRTRSTLHARSLTDLGIADESHKAVLKALKDSDATVWDSVDTLREAVAAEGLGALMKTAPGTSGETTTIEDAPPVTEGMTTAEQRIEALRTQSTPPPPQTPLSHKDKASAAVANGDPMEAIKNLAAWSVEAGRTQG